MRELKRNAKIVRISKELRRATHMLLRTSGGAR
jgi:hypothetical protein